jgi:hypothetical protein
MAVLAETIPKTARKFSWSMALYIVVMSFTYGPIDVPICEGDELALE